MCYIHTVNYSLPTKEETTTFWYMQGRGWISEALELSDRFLAYPQIVEIYCNHPVNEVGDQVELVLFGSAQCDCNILRYVFWWPQWTLRKLQITSSENDILSSYVIGINLKPFKFITLKDINVLKILCFFSHKDNWA